MTSCHAVWEKLSANYVLKYFQQSLFCFTSKYIYFILDFNLKVIENHLGSKYGINWKQIHWFHGETKAQANKIIYSKLKSWFEPKELAIKSYLIIS